MGFRKIGLGLLLSGCAGQLPYVPCDEARNINEPEGTRELVVSAFVEARMAFERNCVRYPSNAEVILLASQRSSIDPPRGAFEPNGPNTLLLALKEKIDDRLHYSLMIVDGAPGLWSLVGDLACCYPTGCRPSIRCFDRQPTTQDADALLADFKWTYRSGIYGESAIVLQSAYVDRTAWTKFLGSSPTKCHDTERQSR